MFASTIDTKIGNFVRALLTSAGSSTVPKSPFEAGRVPEGSAPIDYHGNLLTRCMDGPRIVAYVMDSSTASYWRFAALRWQHDADFRDKGKFTFTDLETHAKCQVFPQDLMGRRRHGQEWKFRTITPEEMGFFQKSIPTRLNLVPPISTERLPVIREINISPYANVTLFNWNEKCYLRQLHPRNDLTGFCEEVAAQTEVAGVGTEASVRERAVLRLYPDSTILIIPYDRSPSAQQISQLLHGFWPAHEFELCKPNFEKADWHAG